MQAKGRIARMTAISWLAPILLAPFIGSFLGVLIERLPTGRSVLWARSQCDSCQRTLSVSDLLPVVSYAILGGRCRTCRAPIGASHLWVEVATTLIAICAVIVAPDINHLWLACGLGWMLLALSWIDVRHFLLLDVLTLPLLLAGLTAQLWLDPSMLGDAAIGAALGYLIFRGVELLYRMMRGRDGLGQGDAKLLAAAGAWVGWQGLGSVITMAAMLGILVGLTLTWRHGHARDFPIPFGPCIALALWLVYVFMNSSYAVSSY